MTNPENIKYDPAKLDHEINQIGDFISDFKKVPAPIVEIVLHKDTSRMLGVGQYTDPEGDDPRANIVVDSDGKFPKNAISKTEYSVGKSVYDVFRHEYGHHLWKQLAEEDKMKFNNIWSKTPRLISDLAHMNNYEGFSEYFGAYTSPLYKQGRLGSKPMTEFFDNLVPKFK